MKNNSGYSASESRPTFWNRCAFGNVGRELQRVVMGTLSHRHHWAWRSQLEAGMGGGDVQAFRGRFDCPRSPDDRRF